MGIGMSSGGFVEPSPRWTQLIATASPDGAHMGPQGQVPDILTESETFTNHDV